MEIFACLVPPALNEVKLSHSTRFLLHTTFSTNHRHTGISWDIFFLCTFLHIRLKSVRIEQRHTKLCWGVFLKFSNWFKFFKQSSFSTDWTKAWSVCHLKDCFEMNVTHKWPVYNHFWPFLPYVCSSFTKLRFRLSFWDA